MHQVTSARIIHIPGDRLREANVERTIDKLRSAGIRDVEVFPGIRPADRGNLYSIGEWGCYQSHVAASRHALESGSTTMVLEDDAVLSGSPDQLAAFLAAADQATWDVLHVGYSSALVFREWDEDLMSQPTLPVRGVVWGLLSYVVRPERLEPILDVLAELPDRDPQLGGGIGADGAWSETNWSLPWMIRRVAPTSYFHQIPGVDSTLRDLPLKVRIRNVIQRARRR